MRAIAHASRDRRLLNIVLAVGIIDALLLVVLVYVAFVDRNHDAVSVLGPIHGLGYLLLLGLTVYGVVGLRCWTWWFPIAVLLTGGPIGTIVGDVYLRGRLQRPSQAIPSPDG